MKATLEGDAPEDFFFFNNGITATCSDYEEIAGGVRAHDFQIVNGAQTVSTLGPVLTKKNNDDVFVLLRLIRTGDKYAHKTVFADQVTRYQNTQNPVRVSDFYSNDPFQLWLESNLARSLSGKGVVPEFHYVRKRGVTPKKGVGRPLTMEELALLRHAVLNGPSLSYGAPKSIWDPATKPNQYWRALGRAGESCDAWSNEEVAQVGWAYTLDQRIKADFRRLAADAKERRFLSVLARYVVALTHRQVVKKVENAEFANFEEIIRNKTRYEEATDRPYKEARKVLSNAYRERETKSHYARQYIGKSEELFDELTDRLTEALVAEHYF
jgi:AIPR protein